MIASNENMQRKEEVEGLKSRKRLMESKQTEKAGYGGN